ncbi:Hypothetical predicted protein [Pelobates cultripes]|uniref:Uncharacterized protein n=1 Tax=Pelobates cultripes TaxID=61616 RepID=A0AAD1THS5_PELCU|nr:Hypothetical predicted protein [Pelobates cultripes]
MIQELSQSHQALSQQMTAKEDRYMRHNIKISGVLASISTEELPHFVRRTLHVTHNGTTQSLTSLADAPKFLSTLGLTHTQTGPAATTPGKMWNPSKVTPFVPRARVDKRLDT